MKNLYLLCASTCFAAGLVLSNSLKPGELSFVAEWGITLMMVVFFMAALSYAKKYLKA